MGAAGTGTDSNRGIDFFGAGTVISTVNGNISMIGNGGPMATGSFNYGAVIFGAHRSNRLEQALPQAASPFLAPVVAPARAAQSRMKGSGHRTSGPKLIPSMEV